jgi:hypothetical protein
VKKSLFLALGAIAITATPAVFAQQTERETETLQVQTQEGTTRPTKDVGALSRQSERDYVANPTGVSLGGMLGNGFSDSYGIGLGLKGGYTLPSRVYIGGNLNYHFGSSAEFNGAQISQSTWYVGPEAGYDFGVGSVIVRPVVGVGMGFNSGQISGVEVAGDDPTTTRVRPYIAPGASVHYPIGDFFVGADSRVMIMSDNNAFTLFGTGGVHL